jgi:hypothetical protein
MQEIKAHLSRFIKKTVMKKVCLFFSLSCATLFISAQIFDNIKPKADAVVDIIAPKAAVMNIAKPDCLELRDTIWKKRKNQGCWKAVLRGLDVDESHSIYVNINPSILKEECTEIDLSKPDNGVQISIYYTTPKHNYLPSFCAGVDYPIPIGREAYLLDKIISGKTYVNRSSFVEGSPGYQVNAKIMNLVIRNQKNTLKYRLKKYIFYQFGVGDIPE